MRRRLFIGMGAAASILTWPPASAESGKFPDRPIRIILGFAPGGSYDPIIRTIQPKMAELLGEPVVVENRPGGSTVIACNAVYRSPPDGYTLLFTGGGGHAVHTIDQPQIPYDPIRDFTPIATTSLADWAFAVAPSLPVTSLAEYIAYCKANPGKVSFASSGTGRINHLAMERFNLAAHIRTVHVPYKSNSNALTDLATGRIHAYFTAAASLLPFIKGGRLRGLAYTSSDPNSVPAAFRFASVGIPELDETCSVEILLGPAKMAPELVSQLSSTIEKVLAMPDVRSAFKLQSEVPYYRNSQQTLERLVSDQERYTKVIRAAGIKMEG